MIRVVLALLFLLIGSPAMAWPTGADAVFEQIAADRDAFGKVVFLYGDSIPRGYALGQLADTVAETAPLYPLASIRSTANWALSLNGRIPQTVFAYAGGFAYISHSLIPQIRDAVSAGVIRSGDVVIVSDAGDHSSDPDAYEAWWAEIRQTITERHDITLVMTSMYDYGVPTDHQYDTVFGTRTMNEATYSAATEDLPYVGQTLFLDLNAKMDAFRTAALSGDGIDIMLPDGIHPNSTSKPLGNGCTSRTCRRSKTS
jgi:hypothetical protein